ncbi:unnamed protein product [Cyclocybe aegerita]|uniref:MYND-type domain-containing protein n=1 Tax=Cyclocybe aegerita TaxID=1973307 RepID=A0A8S0WS97_CYCAE|nr:unnamed protein product [Cyclocybe aegerita]
MRRFKQRKIEDVQAGVERGDADDMLEYGLRLATGAEIPLDNSEARRILLLVFQSNTFSSSQRAVAASLLGLLYYYIVLNSDDWKDFDYDDRIPCSMKFCFESCLLGLHSHICLLVGNMFFKLYGKIPYGELMDKVTFIHGLNVTLRKATGHQDPKPDICESCAKFFPTKTLKKCAGPCHHPTRKPAYCSRECQKEHRKHHREWCVEAMSNPVDADNVTYYTVHLATADYSGQRLQIAGSESTTSALEPDPESNQTDGSVTFNDSPIKLSSLLSDLVW